jgi:hypothetical protein
MTLEQVKAQREALQSARFDGVLTVRAGDKCVTYKSDAELQSAPHDLDREIALAEGRPRANSVKTIFDISLTSYVDALQP